MLLEPLDAGTVEGALMKVFFATFIFMPFLARLARRAVTVSTRMREKSVM